MIEILTNILSPLSLDNFDYIQDCWLQIENGIIYNINSQPQGDIRIDKSDCLCLPGLIDTHVHLSQYDIRGFRIPGLLDWLNKHVFPAEKEACLQYYAEDIARRFYEDSLRKGTTTTVVYTSPCKTACDMAFSVAKEMKVRSIIGMTLMDSNCPKYLKQNSSKAIEDSLDLYNKWHNNSLLDYIFSPRFALTCSLKLLKDTALAARNTDCLIQTHLSENVNEIEEVKKLHPGFSSYTELYASCGLLGEKTIVGHCIHLTDKEIEILKETDTRIAFCPDSNFFLKSGKFPFQKINDAGIKIALASDVGAGTDLSLFNVMKMADYTLNDKGLPPASALYYSTLGAAAVIGKKDVIGSIEAGKEADLLFIKRDEKFYGSPELQLASYIYTNSEKRIDSTWVHGKELFRN